METKNTPLYHSRLDRSRVELIYKNYMEKTSIRGVERVTGHRQATISRSYHLIGEHAELLNEFHLQDVQPGRVEMDELWTFIQKKQNCDDSDKNGVGDLLVYTVVKSDSGLFVAHCCGKRTDKTCNQLLNLVFERFRLPSQTEKILITTDGNPQCANSLVDLYCEPCIDYGQMIKNKKNNRLVDVIRVKIMGNPEIDLKSTSVVEGYNYRIRQRISKFGRKTASFSKKGASCIDALNLFQFMNNFIDLKRNRKTPAMIEGITDHVWSWMEFISYHIQL